MVFADILDFITTAGLSLAATQKSSQEGLTISGKVAAIEDGLLSVKKEPDGQIFKVAAESDKLKGIKVGNRVTVKEVNGWVASTKKTGKAEKKPPKKEMTKDK